MRGSTKARLSALLVALGLAACGGGGGNGNGGGTVAGTTTVGTQPYAAIAGLYEGRSASVTGQAGVNQVYVSTIGELHVHPDGTVAGQRTEAPFVYVVLTSRGSIGDRPLNVSLRQAQSLGPYTPVPPRGLPPG
ncbi:MAG TPA: hypothetical protein VGF26_02920 [Ramlibacter sp.]